MQICHNCHAQQLDGTMFCSECGGSFLSSSRAETISPGQMVPLEPAPQISMQPQALRVSASNGPILSLIVLTSGRRITLDLDEDALIGRKDESRGITPDVDLGQEGGYDAGVSRRHAILSYRNGVYCVEDLNSANGTFVNNRPVTAQSPTPLAEGDELKCGKLPMRVEIGH
jgi:pSer/pThr/pTyr-binding forkhead associated (FHA) protein